MIELRIKEILKNKGMTAKKLAEDIGKAPQYVNSIINGGKGASLNTLQEVAEALKVPVSSLFADYDTTHLATGSQSAKCPYCGNPINIKIEQQTKT